MSTQVDPSAASADPIAAPVAPAPTTGDRVRLLGLSFVMLFVELAQRTHLRALATAARP